jgi:hypothetical protein
MLWVQHAMGDAPKHSLWEAGMAVAANHDEIDALIGSALVPARAPSCSRSGCFDPRGPLPAA